MKIKKVSIIGCGALGIMYGSHMLKSFPADGIQFIADAQRIARYGNTKFYANGVPQTFRFVLPDEDGEPSDLIIFTVKSSQLQEAIPLAQKHIGANTIILSFLNGISSEEIIKKTYGQNKVLYAMVAGMDATKVGDNVNFTNAGYVAFGNLVNNEWTEEIQCVADFFDEVNLKYEVPQDMNKTMWWKYILNIGINQTSALLKESYGLFQTSVYAENLMRMAMDEAYQIARHMGIHLTEADIESCVEIMHTLSPEGKTSMCQDILAKRPTEVELFAGTIIELGETYNIPVPINRFLYNGIKGMESQF